MGWDRITLDVMGNALLAVAEEMGVVLIKSSYSSNIKERRDCSTALFDSRGRLIAQAEHIPMHLGSLSGIVAEVLKRHPVDRLRPGDVFISNDPFTGGGTHLPDITVASPVFAEGALVGFVANIAHHADGGADRPRTIWEEGLRIPPITIVEAGRIREDVMELLLLNFRLPDQRRGDLRAQFAAAEERARALAAGPSLLVCDEITSALDVSVQAAIVELLGALQRDFGLGLLFVTHNLALIRSIADEVAVMSEGRIVEFGTVEDVLEAPKADYTRRLLADTPTLEVVPA